MNGVKQAFTGVSQHIPVESRVQPKAAKTNGVHLSVHGITFPSNAYMTPFTEVQVRVQLSKGSSKSQFVNCRGVVVDCNGINAKRQYEVAVAFLNLPKSVEHELRQARRGIETQTINTVATKLS